MFSVLSFHLRGLPRLLQWEDQLIQPGEQCCLCLENRPSLPVTLDNTTADFASKKLCLVIQSCKPISNFVVTPENSYESIHQWLQSAYLGKALTYQTTVRLPRLASRSSLLGVHQSSTIRSHTSLNTSHFYTLKDLPKEKKTWNQTAKTYRLSLMTTRWCFHILKWSLISLVLLDLQVARWHLGYSTV